MIGVRLDCAGVVVASLVKAGGPSIDTGFYGTIPSAGDLARVLQDVAAPVTGPDQPGDLWVVLWKGEARHIMVYMGPDVHGRQICVRACGERGRVVREEPPRGFRVVQKWTLNALRD